MWLSEGLCLVLSAFMSVRNMGTITNVLRIYITYTMIVYEKYGMCRLGGSTCTGVSFTFQMF